MKTAHHKAEVREFTLKLSLTVKDGKFVKDKTPGATTLPKGQRCALVPADRTGQRYFFTPITEGDAGKTIKVSQIILKCFNEINVPSMSEMEVYVFDQADCETPLGNIVEPDGIDQYGWPSWMLIIGVI